MSQITNGLNDRPRDETIAQSGEGLSDDGGKPIDVADDEIARVKEKLDTDNRSKLKKGLEQDIDRAQKGSPEGGAYARNLHVVFVFAFDLDALDQPLKAFNPRSVVKEVSAVEEARDLSLFHAGVVVWKREADPVVGEGSEPIIVYQTSRIGDFS